MTGKIHNDGEFGPVVLRKNVRSRGISIRVRGSANRDGCRISVTLPWSLRYQDGLNYLEKRRSWVRNALTVQDRRTEEAVAEGRAVVKADEGLVERLRKEAKAILPRKTAFFAGQYGFQYKRLTIKHNSSNWGSCSRAGNINLNLNLVRLPEPLCDYVILHELCHLKEPNHGPKFHAMLEQLCLDNLRRLAALGSPDAVKYEPWIQAAESGTLSTCGLPPLDTVLSREISRWRMV